MYIYIYGLVKFCLLQPAQEHIMSLLWAMAQREQDTTVPSSPNPPCPCPLLWDFPVPLPPSCRQEVQEWQTCECPPGKGAAANLYACPRLQACRREGSIAPQGPAGRSRQRTSLGSLVLATPRAAADDFEHWSSMSRRMATVIYVLKSREVRQITVW